MKMLQPPVDFFATELMMAGDVSFEERRTFLLEAARSHLDHHRQVCHELHEASVAFDEEMGRYGQAGKVGEIRVCGAVEAIAEKRFDVAGPEASRGE